MTAKDDEPVITVDSVTSFLAVVPMLLGFQPEDSLVIVGVGRPRFTVRITLRYDLDPDVAPPAELIAHAVGVLSGNGADMAAVAGYGTGVQVTPLADAVREQFPAAGIELIDVLRVEGGRYWSYICTDLSCCPPEGNPFVAPAGYRSRKDLAASVAAVTGPEADMMDAAGERARRRLANLLASGLRDGTRADPAIKAGLQAVGWAIERYRMGEKSISAGEAAWLLLALANIQVRDDAWARMDKGHRADHRRLWLDLTRLARGQYVAAPATLLAFVAWQAGDGALANIALDRALAADPGYSMAKLLREALDVGAPPSLAQPPMTPEQVAASYAERNAES